MKSILCECLCVSPNVECPFDLAVLQTHTERRFCVPRQEACFHLSRLDQLHSSIPPSNRDKGEPSRMSDLELGISSLVEEG